MRPCLCLSAILLAGCTQFPQLDDTIPPEAEAAGYPELVPIELLLSDIPPPPPDQAADRLEARADALRRRAAQLRSEGLTTGELARLGSGDAG